MKALRELLGSVNVKYLSIVAALLVVCAGTSIYPLVRYSRVSMTVKGHHTLVDGNGITVKTSYESGQTTFYDLHASWWKLKFPYTIDDSTENSLSFTVDPTLRGGILINSPFQQGRVATLEIMVNGDFSGTELFPNRWYRVGYSNDKWFEIEFRMGH